LLVLFVFKLFATGMDTVNSESLASRIGALVSTKKSKKMGLNQGGSIQARKNMPLGVRGVGTLNEYNATRMPNAYLFEMIMFMIFKGP
jgi:hypothetical protein